MKSIKPQFSQEATQKLIEPKLELYKTHNSIVHGHKYQKWNGNGQPKMAPNCGKIQYMRSFKEKVIIMYNIFDITVFLNNYY